MVISKCVNNEFPCASITNKNEETINNRSSYCIMDSDVLLPSFFSPDMKDDASCGWVSISDIIDASCDEICY